MNKNESVFKKVINKEKKKNNKSKLIRILKNISKEENSKHEKI